MQKQIRSAGFVVALAAIAAVAGIAAWAPGPVRAQQQPHGVVRKVVLRQDLSTPGREALMIETTIQPGGAEGWHTHPGTLLVHVVRGPLTFMRQGKGSTTYQTGQNFAVARGIVHQATNHGKTPVRALAILIVDKGKPLATQVK